MAGDTDPARQPFVARLHHRLERAAGTERDLPLVGFDEIVELDQVDVIDAHPFERAFELGAGLVALALAGLGGEIEAIAIRGEERLQPVLRRAVTGGGVDVVDAGGVDRGKGGIGARLAHRAERGGAEDQPGRLMPAPAEGCNRKGHRATLNPFMNRHTTRSGTNGAGLWLT